MAIEPHPVPAELPGPGDDLPLPESPPPTLPEPGMPAPLEASLGHL